ncbi:MAG: type IV pilus assembly protein PilM [Thermodesulfobacteria bacterium]|nr:type IV pilus assembly protein PilM [Thermodesulfobacteriota bacterium]
MKKFSLTDLFRKKPKPTLGVDIGSHTIKVVEFSGGSKKVVKKVGRALLPQGAIVDGSIKDKEVVQEALHKLISNLQPSLKRVSTSISGYSVIVKKIHVPYLGEKEIEENLIVEAEKYVPFEISDVYIDFSVLSTHEDGDGGSDIFLVAAKKEVVDEYANLLEGVGLTPSVIDVDAFTLVNAFELAFGKVEEPAVLIDIGASKTNLNIVRKGMPIFTRDMTIGGEQLTEAIQEATGLSRDDAEAVKIAGTKDNVLAKEISDVVVEMAGLWINEIKKAISFFKTSATPEDFPTCVFLSGGTSMLLGLEEQFSSGLGLESRRLNAFNGNKADKDIDREYLASVAPQMAIASGLAIRSAE